MESKKIIKAPERERKKERYLFEECGYLDERTAWRRPPTCKQPFTQWKLGMNETLWLVFIFVLLLWALMILFRFYRARPGIYEQACLARLKFGRLLWSLHRGFFCFCEKRGEERKRDDTEREREGEGGRGVKRTGERENADTGFFHEFSNNFCHAVAKLPLKKSALNWIVTMWSAPWPV